MIRGEIPQDEKHQLTQHFSFKPVGCADFIAKVAMTSTSTSDLLRRCVDFIAAFFPLPMAALLAGEGVIGVVGCEEWVDVGVGGRTGKWMIKEENEINSK